MKHSTIKNSKRIKAFKIPEGYFEELDIALQKKISPPKSTPTIRKINQKWYYGAVAAIALLLSLPLLNRNNTVENSTLTKEDIESYLEYNSTYGVTSDIINTLDKEDFKEMETSIPLKDKDVDEYVLSHIDLEYYFDN
ncbi:MAG: hypothetical protein LBE34_01230 [Flavobacteriaceae bacterium]|jgi:hypothetical protein|nr:hypothetical protein [Flavobacteriaceae bacterium]